MSSLVESEARFRVLTDAAFEGLCLSEEGRILDANEQFARLFGYDRSDLVGREIVSLIAPQDRAAVAARLRRGGGEPMEHRVVHRDGHLIEAEAQAKTIRLGAHRVRVTALRDVTERKRAEASLRESRERMELIFRHAHDTLALYAVEPDGGCRLLAVNPAFLRSASLYIERPVAEAEVVGQRFERLLRDVLRFDESAIAVNQAHLRRAIRTGKVVRWDEVARRPAGPTSRERADIPILDPSGRCTHVLRVVHDVTEQRKAEAERTRALRREQKAREDFTRRLMASQEAERRRIAGELHDSLGQNLLLAKNRLQAALALPGLTAELRACLEGVAELNDRTLAEVRQISHELRPYQLDQLGLTRALQAVIEAAARGSPVAIEHRIEPVDDRFDAEAAAHLYRIVQEGLNNILKHSGAAHARISLERDLREARLRIEDDGRGFARAAGRDPAGFGLPNLRERVRILGGQATVDSAPGRGVRIDAVLPFAGGA